MNTTSFWKVRSVYLVIGLEIGEDCTVGILSDLGLQILYPIWDFWEAFRLKFLRNLNCPVADGRPLSAVR